jgi:hypothetical protein
MAARKDASKPASARSKKPRPSRRAATRSGRSPAPTNQPVKKWSQRVTDTSDAMDLPVDVFKRAPSAIAASLKRSAERSQRRKSPPYRSAMSMLTFYINRGGRNLSSAQRAKLEQAKVELRKLFGKQQARSS